MEILNRMQEITNEYAQLPQINKFDLSLEAIGDDGTVAVLIQGISRPQDRAERVISPKEDLSFIGHTFTYPNTFHPTSKIFNVDAVKNARFDREGYLVVTHDDSTERFKVDPKQREEVTVILKSKLGNKFN